MGEKVMSLLIDFDRKIVEINGKRVTGAVVVGLPQYKRDDTLQHRLLVNPENADLSKKLPRIEVVFEPGSLCDATVTGSEGAVSEPC